MRVVVKPPRTVSTGASATANGTPTRRSAPGAVPDGSRAAGMSICLDRRDKAVHTCVRLRAEQCPTVLPEELTLSQPEPREPVRERCGEHAESIDATAAKVDRRCLGHVLRWARDLADSKAEVRGLRD